MSCSLCFVCLRRTCAWAFVFLLRLARPRGDSVCLRGHDELQHLIRLFFCLWNHRNFLLFLDISLISKNGTQASRCAKQFGPMLLETDRYAGKGRRTVATHVVRNSAYKNEDDIIRIAIRSRRTFINTLKSDCKGCTTIAT